MFRSKEYQEMEFSSDESDVEFHQEVDFKEIALSAERFSIKNRSFTLTGFQNLPPEIIFNILKFVDVKSLLLHVKLVSRYFYDFLTSSDFWEMRLANSLKNSHTGSQIKISDCELTSLEERGLARSVCEIEMARNLSFTKSLIKNTVSSNHFGDVHCVKILSYPAANLAISGSRDKTICVYNLNLFEDASSQCIINTNNDHNGWIWTLNQEANGGTKIVSGSWDSFINFYEIGRGELEKISDIAVHSAILCTQFEPNFLLYGTYSKLVVGYDVRSATVAFKVKQHTKPVLSVASSENYIWSTGEDHALSCHDRRAGKLFKRIRMERISSSIQYTDPYLWVSGYDGFIKCFNQEMKLVSKFDSGHTLPITDMAHSTGATVTASKDGTVKLFTPNLKSNLWNSFMLDSVASCIDYKDGVVMAGCCDSTVAFWKYKN